MALTRPLGSSRRTLRAAQLPQPLFDRQIQAAARVVPLSTPAHAMSMLFTGVFILPVDGRSRLVWTVIGVLMAVTLTLRWMSPKAIDTRRIYREMLAFNVLFAALWTVATAWTFSSHSLGPEVLLAGLIGGVIGTGAINFSTNRTLGLTWVLAISVGPALVFLAQRDTILTQLAGLLFLYDIAMVMSVLQISGSFTARFLAEQAAELGQLDLQLLLRDFEAGARDWLWETDGNGHFSHVSDRFSELSGKPVEQLHSLTVLDLLRRLRSHEHPSGLGARDQLVRDLEQRRPFSEILVPVWVRDGWRWWALSGKPHGTGWRGLGSDMTETKLAKERIDRLATTDSVTGLPNRYAFGIELAQRLNDTDAAPVTHLGILDLDNFKTINDTLGHQVGDKLIAAIGGALAASLEDDEFCARFGGDEFAVILAGDTNSFDAAGRFTEIHRSIKERTYPVSGNLLEVTSSIGVAGTDQLDGDGQRLISAADLALYAAKASGRDRVQLWNQQMTDAANERAELIHDLTLAIARREFEVFWQPQIDLDKGNVVGLEALVRWDHPRRGLLAPGLFLKAATESGLIVGIGELVLQAALKAAQAWPEQLRISVNVSARELLSTGFVANVVREVESSGVSPGRLVMEVTEDVIVSAEARNSLLALRRVGIEISMDDFGTGYSSFALLATMPFDEIKIDRSFVQPLPDGDATFRTLVSTIVDMTAALGVRVVAEGVETDAQRDILHDMGCQHYQGYLGARPAPFTVINRFLVDRVASAER